MPWMAQPTGSAMHATAGSTPSGTTVGETGGHHHRRCHAAVEVDPECPLVRAQVLPAQAAVAARAAVQVRLDGYQVALADVR